jgi:hypothetical protein
MRLRRSLLVAVVFWGGLSLAKADDSSGPKTEVIDPQEEATFDGHSVLHQVVLYLPNRVFDLLDVFRIRAEVGPGLAAGVRATKVAQAYVGSHASIYAGLPGPRRKASIPIPVGLESHNGVTVSVLDATVDGGIGPNYSPTEIGVSIHPLIFGVDVGVDPIEVLDFVVGLAGVDIKDDDV